MLRYAGGGQHFMLLSGRCGIARGWIRASNVVAAVQFAPLLTISRPWFWAVWEQACSSRSEAKLFMRAQRGLAQTFYQMHFAWGM